MTRRHTQQPHRLQAVIALCFTVTGPCVAMAEAPTAAVPPAHARAPYGSLEARVQTLTKALDLDPAQQASLRKVLQIQRDEVAEVWSNSAISAQYRIGATRVIGDRTADGIRALLTEEQKKKYNPPAPAREPPADSSRRSVEDWMHATSNPNNAGSPVSGTTAAQ